uniref:Uncharacterized protein n=1 Tax=Rhizophora mucronata TaxID=61149 RepID=A0A2P2Q420_RHIMU
MNGKNSSFLRFCSYFMGTLWHTCPLMIILPSFTLCFLRHQSYWKIFVVTLLIFFLSEL